MWFALVLTGLAALTVSGLYVRRRLTGALATLGAPPRAISVMRWAMAWLMWGFPLVLTISIVLAIALGWPTIPRYDGLWASRLLGLPFILTVLVVLQSVLWVLAIDVAYLVVRARRGAAAAIRARGIAVLAVVGAFALYTPIRIVAERGVVRLRHHQVGRGSGAPLRIAFLADVQQDVFTDGDRAREIYARVNAERPDLVLSGGDWINTGPDYIESAAAAAGTLASRLGTFSVHGDHEHFAYRDRTRSVDEVVRAMQAHHVAMLDNEVRWFDHDGKRIGVLFLNYNYIVRTDHARIEALVAQLAKADYAIVVTHQFDAKLAAAVEGKVDLVLAGHTHGGQVNPVVGVCHVALARLETPFVDGRYALGARTTAIVTSGIGYSVVPIRYAAPGSIEIIDLTP
ncbi:MAG TPA: metallophosphoesterase [Kofleriaceae bacterium]|nr:metallophosphoesterase [Kofleriaceae bacterium]